MVLYVPASHIVHDPPFGPEKPALHRQSEGKELPAGDAEDAGQLLQVEDEDAPAPSEYVPA